MIIETIHTRVLIPPQDDLLAVMRESLTLVPEKSIVVITSKVVSIWQGRCIPFAEVLDKDALIIQEAQTYLPREYVPGKWVMHTIKNNLLIPTSGIDESNAKDHYILWPEKVHEVAKKLYYFIRENYQVQDVGVIISDSHSIPLRRGVVGISLSHHGFHPLNDYRHTKDLFDREMKISQTNVVDGIAAAAVLCMGEGKESTPIALVKNIDFVQFAPGKEFITDEYSSLEVSPQEDLYAPFIASVPWKPGGEYNG